MHETTRCAAGHYFKSSGVRTLTAVVHVEADVHISNESIHVHVQHAYIFSTGRRPTRRCARLLGMAQRKRARSADEDTVAAKRLRSDMLEEFQCPITFSLPDDPVMAEDGKVYERAAIEAWLARTADRKVKSPLTGLPMGRKLTEASQVRNLIKRLHEEEASEVKEEADAVPVAAAQGAVAAPPAAVAALPAAVAAGPAAAVAAGPAARAAPLAVRVERVPCSHCEGHGAFYNQRPSTKSCITTDCNLCDGTGKQAYDIE